MLDLVVKNGTVVCPSGTFSADVGISETKIKKLGQGFNGDREVDATGCYVIPGGVDPHTHLEMPTGNLVSADTFRSGTLAGAYGGTTTVIDFVEPRPKESFKKALERRREEADDGVVTDYSLHMTIPQWHAEKLCSPERLQELIEEGLTSFKLYQAYEGMRLDDKKLFQVMKDIGRVGGLPIIHSENGPVCEALTDDMIQAGEVGAEFQPSSRPPRQEGEAVRRAIDIAVLADTPLYVVHVSTQDSLKKIEAARFRGESVYGETGPQYLVLDKKRLDNVEGQKLICSPPLRGDGDRLNLWRGIEMGILQLVATDHCPFTEEEKLAPDRFDKVPGGLPSIEVRTGLIYDRGVNSGRISLERWVEIIASAPANLFGLKNKGLLAPGYDADVVIFDPSVEKVISPDVLHEDVDWTPYEGFEVEGWPRTVISGGDVLIEDGELVGETNKGQFVPREVSSIAVKT